MVAADAWVRGCAAVTAPEIRPAATVLLVRRDPVGARVLMGQRGAGAAFLPSKYVFPGGAVDPADGGAEGFGPTCRTRLEVRPNGTAPAALWSAAHRELAEETGVSLAPGAPLVFFFRAITPAGRPRRFDARFFLADAGHLTGDPDDFADASDELSHLHWVPVADTRGLALPFVTEVVLAELAAALASLPPGAPLAPPPSVPFFDNAGPDFRLARIA